MKVFDEEQGWDSKTNFVDVNNVVVGWDTAQNCCEVWGNHFQLVEPLAYQADWPTDGVQFTAEQLEPYVFDPEYRQEYSNEDEGRCAVFKLVGEGLPPLYLVLNNSHNGYYSHGFKMDKAGVTIHEGNL